MPKIQCLDPHLADLIAAGEVVERPASVVKELTENAIDAGAHTVTVEIRRGGMSYLRVTDDGCGIAAEDVETAFLRHATSKLHTEYDLEAIGTLGFRGEALAAIAAVSKVEITTKPADEPFGTAMLLDAGVVRDRAEAGCPNGTTLIVRELFYNTPARLKYMKRDAAEGAAVYAVVQHEAMSHPEISFRFLREGKQELQTPGDGNLQSAVYAVLGRELALGYLPCKSSGGEIEVEGFLSRPVCCRGTRSYQHFFVNGRYVKSRTMTAALEQAYANQKLVGKFPGCVLHLKTKLNAVDVNVHPAKTEVRFLNEKALFDAVYHASRFALEQEQGHPDAFPEPKRAANAAPAAAPKQDFYQHLTAEEYREKSTLVLRDSAALPFVTDGAEHTPAAPTGRERPLTHSELRSHALTREQLLGGLPETIPDEAEAWDEPSAPSEAAAPAETGSAEAPVPAAGETAAPPSFRPLPRGEAVREVNPVEPDLTVPYEEPSAPERTAVPEPEPPDEESEPAPLVDETPAWRIAGEVLNTYVIVEQGDTVYLIDKHAAHERINFDRLKARDYHAMPQLLLTPLVLHPEPGERAVLLEHSALLAEYGFAVEDFGGGALVVREVPDYLAVEEAEGMLSELAETLLTTGTADPSAARDNLLHTIACKSAIKGGWVNGEAELRVVVEAVLSGQVRYCPHGRPVAITMTRRQIEKQFKRIV